MSDGVANYVMAGFYNTILAKQEALDKAKEAWEVYGIRVFAVAYTDTADIGTMQQIALLGNGTFYFANVTNITDVYYDIAVELTKVYPQNGTLDIGADGDTEWDHPGPFTTSENINFTD